MTSVCQENGEWSVKSIEDCKRKLNFVFQQGKLFKNVIFRIVLPCEEAYPPAPEGGRLWYNLEAIRYKCPPTHMFPDGSEFAFSNCTHALKKWIPEEMEQCVGKPLNV